MAGRVRVVVRWMIVPLLAIFAVTAVLHLIVLVHASPTFARPAIKQTRAITSGKLAVPASFVGAKQVTSAYGDWGARGSTLQRR